MKTFDSDMGRTPEVDPQDLVGIDREGRIEVGHREVVDFIDEWLAGNAWTIDTRVIDFALDVRNMLSENAAPLPEPVGASA